MGVSNTLGVRKGKVEGSPSIIAIVIASRAASVGESVSYWPDDRNMIKPQCKLTR